MNGTTLKLKLEMLKSIHIFKKMIVTEKRKIPFFLSMIALVKIPHTSKTTISSSKQT